MANNTHLLRESCAWVGAIYSEYFKGKKGKTMIDSITFTNNMIMLPRRKSLHKDGPALKRIWNTIKRDPETLKLKESWNKLGDLAENLGYEIYDSTTKFNPETLNRQIQVWISKIKFIASKLNQIKVVDSKPRQKRHSDLFGINSAKSELKNSICKKLLDTVNDFFKPFQVFATFYPQKAAEACNRAISSLKEVKKLVEQYLERYSKRDSIPNRMLMDIGRGRALVGRSDETSGFFSGIKNKISNKLIHLIHQLKQYAENFKKLPGGQKVKTAIFGLIYALARFNQVKSIKEAIAIAKIAKKNIENVQYNVNEITIENGEVVANEVPKEMYIARNVALFLKGMKFFINQIIAMMARAAISKRLVA